MCLDLPMSLTFSLLRETDDLELFFVSGRRLRSIHYSSYIGSRSHVLLPVFQGLPPREN
jgi:hypothetical protein